MRSGLDDSLTIYANVRQAVAESRCLGTNYRRCSPHYGEGGYSL
ncbi:hypothetical protein MICAI_1490010 [Microcystis sp. T1-4]|nr:hypothetical protein MICAI_1490010 [Microcystis sp. T1-4]